MDNDTLTAGVSPDGIKNRTDIRILICFMLDQFDDPLTKTDLIELIFENQYANSIETLSAIEHLIENDHLMYNTATDALLLSPLGKRVSDDLSSRLPTTIKEKSRAAIDRKLTRRRNERDNGFISERQENGEYKVTCIIGSKEPSSGALSVTLLLPTKSRVSDARERFYDDPEGLYRLIYAYMTGDDTLLNRD